jgi:hypothetical protein
MRRNEARGLNFHPALHTNRFHYYELSLIQQKTVPNEEEMKKKENSKVSLRRPEAGSRKLEAGGRNFMNCEYKKDYATVFVLHGSYFPHFHSDRRLVTGFATAARIA